MQVLESLNENFFGWMKKINVDYCRLLRQENALKDLDIAFIEGAISSAGEEKRAKEIREKAGKVVLLGSCAIDGRPSNHRNFFNESQRKEIKPILERFKLYEKVKPVKEVIQADIELNGCPIDEKKFIELMNELIGKK